MLTNWKTSLCGLVAAIAIALQSSDWSNWKTLLTAAAVAGIGFVAKDHNVTGGDVKQ